MDKHFQTADLSENLPVVMALLSVWYSSFFGAHSHAIVPYAQRLNQFPAFLQQLTMESLGKQVDLSGQEEKTKTGEIVWGSTGTNAQHSFFQLLHQGTEIVPVDFITFVNSMSETEDEDDRHLHLLANCLSQSLALMQGDDGAGDPHRAIPGNRPSNTLLIDNLTPYSIGQLVALYEHKTFAQSVIWNINAFDQWGVELGKVLSREVFAAVHAAEIPGNLDQSTTALVTRIRSSLKN